MAINGPWPWTNDSTQIYPKPGFPSLVNNTGSYYQGTGTTFIREIAEGEEGIVVTGNTADGVVVRGAATTTSVFNAFGYAASSFFFPVVANTRSYWGFLANPQVLGSNNASEVIGFLSAPFTSMILGLPYTATVNNLTFFAAKPSWNGGNVTNLVGFKMYQPDLVSGTWRNQIGLEIADMVNGTNSNFAIFTGKGLVRLGDNLNVSSNVTATFYKGNGTLLSGICLTNGTACNINNFNKTNIAYVNQSNIFTDTNSFTNTVQFGPDTNDMVQIRDDGGFQTIDFYDDGSFQGKIYADSGTSAMIIHGDAKSKITSGGGPTDNMVFTDTSNEFYLINLVHNAVFPEGYTANARGYQTMGTSGLWAHAGGLFANMFTSNGTSGTAETRLHNYSLPANSLSSNGMGFDLVAGGSFAATINNKQIKVVLQNATSNQTLYDSGACPITTSQEWRLETNLVRINTTTIKSISSLSTTSAATCVYADYATATYNSARAYNLTITGTGGATNDIIMEMSNLDWHDS